MASSATSVSSSNFWHLEVRGRLPLVNISIHKSMEMPLSVFTLCFSSIFLSGPVIAFVLPSSTRPSNGFIIDTLAHVRHCSCAAQAASKIRPRLNKRLSSLRMDDEVARKGIKEELTTRDEYLATRFTKLSSSGHDLTPFTPSETREAASHLTPEQKAVLFGGGSEVKSTPATRVFRSYSEKGLYACSVGGLPLFTSGWKLEAREVDDGPSFAEPCDEEHLLEEFDAVEGKMFISCARSRLRIGRLIADPLSPSGKRYLVVGAALEFHPLGTPLPVRCQPENYWGSEGQYRAWTFS